MRTKALIQALIGTSRNSYAKKETAVLPNPHIYLECVSKVINRRNYASWSSTAVK